MGRWEGPQDTGAWTRDSVRPEGDGAGMAASQKVLERKWACILMVMMC